MVILGIDPGTTRIGYGLINKNGRIKLIDYGVIEIKAAIQKDRLVELSSKLEELIKKYQPEAAGIEKLYFAKNQKTALSVAEARGVIILTLAKNSVPIKEFDPKEIKAAITGYGGSDKEAVRRIVALSLGIPKLVGLDDASDALAIAIRTAFEGSLITP